MEKRTIWARIGVTIEATPEEIDTILANNDCSGDALDHFFKKCLKEGRCKIDGDSYIPESEIERYNAEHGTQYEVAEYGTDLTGGNLVWKTNTGRSKWWKKMLNMVISAVKTI